MQAAWRKYTGTTIPCGNNGTAPGEPEAVRKGVLAPLILVMGFIDASLRYLLECALPASGGFPAATLVINICSCILPGIVLAAQASLNEVLYLAATMGFLGEFSTLSTMNHEAVELVLGGKRTLGAGHLAAAYASTLGAAALGFAIASAVM